MIRPQKDKSKSNKLFSLAVRFLSVLAVFTAGKIEAIQADMKPGSISNEGGRSYENVNGQMAYAHIGMGDIDHEGEYPPIRQE